MSIITKLENMSSDGKKAQAININKDTYKGDGNAKTEIIIKQNSTEISKNKMQHCGL